VGFAIFGRFLGFGGKRFSRENVPEMTELLLIISDCFVRVVPLKGVTVVGEIIAAGLIHKFSCQTRFVSALVKEI